MPAAAMSPVLYHESCPWYMRLMIVRWIADVLMLRAVFRSTTCPRFVTTSRRPAHAMPPSSHAISDSTIAASASNTDAAGWSWIAVAIASHVSASSADKISTPEAAISAALTLPAAVLPSQSLIA